MVLKTKRLEIPAELMEDNWTTNVVVIKRFTALDKSQITDRAMAAKISSAGISGQVSLGTAKSASVMTGVVEAPWKVNDPVSLGQLDGVLFDWLFDEITEFNSFSDKKKVSLSDSSTQEERQK